MKTRNIRIDDDLWDQATQRAKAEDMSVSQLIRRWLRWYAAGVMPTTPSGIVNHLQ